jgi:hypothetical protein
MSFWISEGELICGAEKSHSPQINLEQLEGFAARLESKRRTNHTLTKANKIS